MTRILTALGLAVAIGVVSPSASRAQITGVVTNSAGDPIEGVVVEAWSDQRRLASRITDREGSWSFSEAVARRTTRLRAGGLGYRLVDRPVEPGPGEYRLELEPEPISLRGLTVDAERNRCEIDDQDDARRLWERLRRRYAGPMDTVGVATYLAQADTLVSRGGIAPLKISASMRSQRGSSSQLRFSWARRVQRSGYAFPVRRTDSGRSFDSWSYAPLEAGFAPHFVDDVFGDLHRFRIRDRGAFGWILEFCPRDRDDPWIHGTMRIGPDTTLVSAEWLFETPEPDESAGGRAFFPPVTGPPDRTYPLPRESLVWRQMPEGHFQEVHQRFEGWIVAPGDTVPFLPPRKPAGN